MKPKYRIARWQSLKGKHWVEVLECEDGTFSFRADGAGGSGYRTRDEALDRGALEASFYNVKMRRVL